MKKGNKVVEVFDFIKIFIYECIKSFKNKGLIIFNMSSTFSKVDWVKLFSQ